MTSSDRDRPADQHDHTGHAFARREPAHRPADAARGCLGARARGLRAPLGAVRSRRPRPAQGAVRAAERAHDAARVDGRGPASRSVTPSTRPASSSCSCAATTIASSSPSIAPTARPWPAPSPTRSRTSRSTPRRSRPTAAPDRVPVLLADGRLSAHRKPTVLRLYRPRVEPVGRLRYGHETAVQLEFWRFGDETVEAPRENALMRRTLPALRGHRRHGAAARPRLADARAHVRRRSRATSTSTSTWCSRGSTARATSSSASAPRAWQSTSSARATTVRRPLPAVDELRVRAAQRAHVRAVGAPHLHRDRLARARRGSLEHPKVTIVRSEEFFADTSVLPTHNSHAVEASCTASRASPSTSSTRTTTCSSAARSSPSCSSPPAGITQVRRGGDAHRRSASTHAAPQRARQRRCA